MALRSCRRAETTILQFETAADFVVVLGSAVRYGSFIEPSLQI
jgi:hypothetical protein